MKQSKRILSKTTIFLLVFTILTALHGVVLVYLYYSQYNKDLAIILKSQENMIEFEGSRIRTELGDVFQDLLFLEGIIENNLLESSESRTILPGSSVYHKSFHLLGVLTQRYESIQIVSPGGDELYKLNFTEDGQSSAVASEELRKGLEEYYFQEIDNNSDSLYLSNMKLSRENGVISQPHTPIIRVGRGINNSRGEIAAYLILDYKGNQILDHLGEYEILPEEMFNTYLINNEGYLISSPDNRPTFAFQFPELKNKTIAKELPDLWLQLQMNESGSFYFDNNYYVHRRIELERVIPEGRARYLTEQSHDQRSYYLIFETPGTVLRSFSAGIIRSLIIPFLIIQSIITLLALLVARWADRLQRYQEKLLHFSSMDDMTGCMNRRTGRKILENYVSLSRRRNSDLTVVYLDLNNLKSVNDRWGHKEGDHYILTMVDLIKEQLRSTDFFIRMGGDEFLLILPDCSKDQALQIRNRVLLTEHKLNSEKIYPYCLGMSWGIVELDPDKHMTVQEILYEADKLMYAEKTNYPQLDEALIKELEENLCYDHRKDS